MKCNCSLIKPCIIGWIIVLIFLSLALLSIETPARDYLVPYAPYLQIGFLVGLSILAIPHIRLKTQSKSFLFLLLLYMLCILALASSFWSTCGYLVIKRTFMIFGTSMIVALLTISDPRPIETFRKIAKVLAIFGGFVSLLGITLYFFGTLEAKDYGLVQSLANHPLLSQRIYLSSSFLRISSLFGNPNSLASWLMLTLPMSFYFVLKASNKTRIAWIFIMIVQLCALYLTFSRAGILSTAVGMFLLLWLSVRKQLILRQYFLIVLFLSVVLGVILIYFTGMHQTGRVSLDLNYREIIWGTLWESILDKPLSGVGFGVSYEAILEPEGLDFAAHNTYLAMLSELGIVGFLLFLLIWFFPMWDGMNKLRNASPLMSLPLATSLAILAAFVVHELFEGLVLRFGFHTLIWIYLLTWMTNLKQEERNYDKK